MKVESLISFGGRCEEALEFYKKAVGAEITALMRWNESPDSPFKPPAGYEEKIMHANFRIGETQLMADDGMGDAAADFRGITLAIEAADDAEAKRVFSALGEGGRVNMPLAKTFWTSSFGHLTDKFGVPWIINVTAPKP